MNIITENGKDYLESFVAKIDNKNLDASSLFVDIRETIEAILKKYNTKHKTKYTYIDKGQYGGNLQSMWNRFSGDYFSPSFLKNYVTNPAMCLMQSFFEESVNDATAIGTTFHKIMELYYQLPPEERVREKLWEIEASTMSEGQDKAKLDEYITGYIKSGDYLGGEMNDKLLTCDTERYGRTKENLTIPKFGYTLPCALSYVVDRIDYRDNGVYILDYKTGHPKPEAVTFDGYLGSMLLYKWAMEQELGIQIDHSYLIAPGNSDPYMKLDFSEDNQKKMIDIIDRFYRQFMRDKSRKIFEFTNQGYFTTDDARSFRSVMNDNTIWMAKLPVKLYIGNHDDTVF